MYSVLWTERAQNELATIWMAASSDVRRQITNVLAEVEQQLRADAARLGESREDDVRLFLAPPIGIEFRVSDPDRRSQCSGSGAFGAKGRDNGGCLRRRSC